MPYQKKGSRQQPLLPAVYLHLDCTFRNQGYLIKIMNLGIISCLYPGMELIMHPAFRIDSFNHTLFMQQYSPPPVNM